MNAQFTLTVFARAIAVPLLLVAAGSISSFRSQQQLTANAAKQKPENTASVRAANAVAESSPDIDLNPRVFIGESDGSNMKPLLDLPEYDIQGMPSWSSDGNRIALEAWRSSLKEIHDDSKIVVVNADGSHPRILGDGGVPSFSPRGDRIVFRRVDPNKGIWVMSSEGPEKELLSIAPDGWNPRWSPVDQRVAYITYGANPNLVVFDLVEKKRTPLFEQSQCPYSSFLWNVAWSPDGTKIAFKGMRVTDGKWELGIIDARGAAQGLVTRLSAEVWGITWCGDCNRLFFGMWTPARGGGVQLFSLNPNNKEPPRAVTGLDPGRRNGSALHSRDGKKLIMVSAKLPPKDE
jgi:Tol biopolymer transport system component